MLNRLLRCFGSSRESSVAPEERVVMPVLGVDEQRQIENHLQLIERLVQSHRRFAEADIDRNRWYTAFLKSEQALSIERFESNQLRRDLEASTEAMLNMELISSGAPFPSDNTVRFLAGRLRETTAELDRLRSEIRTMRQGVRVFTNMVVSDKRIVCPISTEPVQDPVLLTCGHVFERESIQRWFATMNTSRVCPFCRQTASEITFPGVASGL